MSDSTVMLLVRELEFLLSKQNPSLRFKEQHRLELARLLGEAGPAAFLDLLEKVVPLASSVNDPDLFILTLSPQWTELS